MSDVSSLRVVHTFHILFFHSLLIFLSAGLCPIAPLKMLLKRSIMTATSLNPVTQIFTSCLTSSVQVSWLCFSWKQSVSLTSAALLSFLLPLPTSPFCWLFFFFYLTFKCWIFSRLDPRLISLLTLYSSTGWAHSFWGFSLTSDMDSFQRFCLSSSLEWQPRHGNTCEAPLLEFAEVPQTLCVRNSVSICLPLNLELQDLSE